MQGHLIDLVAAIENWDLSPLGLSEVVFRMCLWSGCVEMHLGAFIHQFLFLTGQGLFHEELPSLEISGLMHKWVSVRFPHVPEKCQNRTQKLWVVPEARCCQLCLKKDGCCSDDWVKSGQENVRWGTRSVLHILFLFLQFYICYISWIYGFCFSEFLEIFQLLLSWSERGLEKNFQTQGRI